MQHRVPNLNGLTALGETPKAFGLERVRLIDGLLTRQDPIGDRFSPPAPLLVDIKRNHAVALTVFAAA